MDIWRIRTFRVVMAFALMILWVGNLPAAENGKQIVPKSMERPAGTAGSSGLEDRRWIIKEKAAVRQSGQKNKPEKIEWKGEQQKKLCADLAMRMKDAFQKARYHSIQGDSCATMELSKRFLETVEQCRKECPDGYLNKIGYNDQSLRNISILNRSGKERCLGKIKPATPEAQGKEAVAPSSSSKEQAQ